MPTGKLEKLNIGRSLVEDVYNRIHNAIVTGVLRPNERLHQVAIAEELGVSPRTVREALMRIVVEGLAIHAPNRGFRVTSLPVSELEEIYQMRSLLEGWAMKLAASRISKAELDRMRQLLPSTAATVPPASVLETHAANRRFHMIAIESSRKPHLSRVLAQLWQLIFTHYWVEGDVEVFIEDGRRELQDHERLLRALEGGDGEEARRIAVEHIESTLQGLLRDWENRQSRHESTDQDALRLHMGGDDNAN